MYKIDAFLPSNHHIMSFWYLLNPLIFYSWMVHKATQEKRGYKIYTCIARHNTDYKNISLFLCACFLNQKMLLLLLGCCIQRTKKYLQSIKKSKKGRRDRE